MLKTYLPYFIIALLIIILLAQRCDSSHRQSIDNSNLKAMSDSLHISRNSLGQEVVTTSVLTGSVNSLKSELKYTKDSAWQVINKLLDKNTDNVVYTSVVTSEDGKTKTTVSVDSNKLKKDSCKNYIYPVYKTSWSEKWSTGSITANKDSITRDIKVRNDFTIKQQWVSDGFLKPKVLKVTMTNISPLTATKEIKAFSATQPKANRLVWLGVGLAIGVFGFALIHLLP